MYKILPILLFTILIAEENSILKINQSDSLDFVWAESTMDEIIDNVNAGISNIINKDKLIIKTENRIIDVFVAESTSEVIKKHLEELEKVDDNVFFWIHVPDSIDSHPPAYISYKLSFEVNIDKSIILNSSLKTSILGIIESNSIGYRKEDVIFNSVDINQFQSKNTNTVSLNRDDIYNDSWAVIIGIDKYQYSDPLNYAVKDAEAVRNMLINKFDYPEENIRYLTDEEATLSNIKLNLGEVAISAGENDRILVFYSGHGETLEGADGSKKGYIIPYEGKQDNPFGTGFSMSEIATTAQMSKAKHMLFLMDACYSGLMKYNVKGLSKTDKQGYLSTVANEKARQLITAGDGNQQVIEKDEWQHSAFTKNLIEGLDSWDADFNGDGYITADELGLYLRENVTEDSDNLQTPQEGRFEKSGGGEFVFFSDHNISNKVEESRFNNLSKETMALIKLVGEEKVQEILIEQMKASMEPMMY